MTRSLKAPRRPNPQTEKMETAETAIIAVDRLPLDYNALKPYLERGVRLFIEVGPSGRALKRPIEVAIPKGVNRRDFDIINYIVSSLPSNYPSLIPWALRNRSLIRLAAYLRRYKSSSPGSLAAYLSRLHRFTRWIGIEPDELIARCLTSEGLPDPKGIKEVRGLLEEYVGELRARGLAPNTINTSLAAIKTLFKVSHIELGSIPLPTPRVVYEDRAPRPEELWRMLQVADLRGKVIISMLALGGFRAGTLCQLKYRHVKHDLERGIEPIHIHVEAEITKGKYGSYDTFIGAEAVEYLRLYLEARRRGSYSGKLPPETITDDTPLIREHKSPEPRPLTRHGLLHIVRKIYHDAGLSYERRGRRYVLRPHSLRKFFRTQLAAKGVPADYIEYMMGHRVSTYHDIRMKGVEFLRRIYAQADLRIRPREKADIYSFIEDILRSRGFQVDRELLRRAIVEPHRTVITGEEERRRLIREAFLEMLRRELLEP